MHLTYWSFRIHVLIRVDTSARHHFGFFFLLRVLNNFLILWFSSRPVNKHVVHNTCQEHHPIQSRENVMFVSWLSLSSERMLHCAMLPSLWAKVSIQSPNLNAGKKKYYLRKLDTYPATVNPFTFGSLYTFV